VATPLAPRIARYYSVGDRDNLQDAVRRSARASLYFSAPLALVMVAFQDWIFILFGEGFTGEGSAFAVLIAGGLFNASTAPGVITS
jgi:O-antigen/teichoic acid export membrane protein